MMGVGCEPMHAEHTGSIVYHLAHSTLLVTSFNVHMEIFMTAITFYISALWQQIDTQA